MKVRYTNLGPNVGTQSLGSKQGSIVDTQIRAAIRTQYRRNSGSEFESQVCGRQLLLTLV